MNSIVTFDSFCKHILFIAKRNNRLKLFPAKRMDVFIEYYIMGYSAGKAYRDRVSGLI